jgi:hypothetical protein
MKNEITTERMQEYQNLNSGNLLANGLDEYKQLINEKTLQISEASKPVLFTVFCW